MNEYYLYDRFVLHPATSGGFYYWYMSPMTTTWSPCDEPINALGPQQPMPLLFLTLNGVTPL